MRKSLTMLPAVLALASIPLGSAPASAFYGPDCTEPRTGLKLCLMADNDYPTRDTVRFRGWASIEDDGSGKNWKVGVSDVALYRIPCSGTGYWQLVSSKTDTDGLYASYERDYSGPLEPTGWGTFLVVANFRARAGDGTNFTQERRATFETCP